MTIARRRLAAIHWLCAFVIFGAFFLRLSVLWDGDSYYHLAVARFYAAKGPAAPIPWTRFSILGGGADKDLLFHLLLMPFAAAPDAAIGGRVALAMLNATLATIVGVLASIAIGDVGFLVPLWLWIAAPQFFARVVRVRPELLALAILLLAVLAAARRRFVLLGVLAFAFTTGYTAFQVFGAICAMWFAWSWFRARIPTAALIVAPAIGIAAGLALRPHPLANLHLWYVQNVLFFFNTSRLDVGNEIFPPALLQTLWINAAWIAAMIVLAVLAHRHRRDGADSVLPYMTIAAIVFDVLFLRMGRMSLYAFPLTTLAVLFAIGTRVPARVVAAVLAFTALGALPLNFDRQKIQFIEAGATDVSELDLFAFGSHVPPGAKVAATWSDAESYAFWAPQGRYLNVLDPIFMAIPYPRQYDAQRRLFQGGDPDIPFTVKRVLDSDYLALDWTLVSGITAQRLRDDPRLQVVYGGYNLLLRVTSPTNARFVVNWQPLPADHDPIRGFVDATSLAGSGCATLTHDELLSDVQHRDYEFVPWGPSTLWLDGRQVVDVTSARAAVIGQGERIALDLVPGRHRFIVRTCRAAGLAGFDLIERKR